MRPAHLVVAACIVGLTFSSSAMFFSTVGVFLKPIAAEFGWGRTQLAAGVSIAAFCSALVATTIGRTIDRHGARRVVLVSTTALSLAIASLALLPKVYPVYMLIAALIGVAGTGCTSFAYLSVLPAWFDKRFGLSLAFATMGVGLGQAIGPLYSNFLIGEVGWRNAYALLGLTIVAVTVPNALVLFREGPGGTIARRQNAPDQPGATLAEAVRSRVFWRLAASFCLVTVAVTGCNVHIVPLLTDRGLDPAAAARVAALAGTALLVTRFVSGVLLDYVSARLLGVVLFGGCALGILLVLEGGPGWTARAGVILIGAALGVEGDLIAYTSRRVFGRRAYAAIYGSLFAAFNIGVVAGPLLMGISFDLSGSYHIGLACLSLLAGLAAVLMLPRLPSFVREDSPVPLAMAAGR